MDCFELAETLHGLYHCAIGAVEQSDYGRLFWLMHERQRFIDRLEAGGSGLPDSLLAQMLADTVRLHELIQEHAVKLEDSRAEVLRTAEARRSYVKSVLSGGTNRLRF